MSKLLSASRLNDFLGCAYRAALWLDDIQAPEEEDASLELVRSKGFEHEARILAGLEAIHGAAARISERSQVEQRVAETLSAIADQPPWSGPVWMLVHCRFRHHICCGRRSAR